MLGGGERLGSAHILELAPQIFKLPASTSLYLRCALLLAVTLLFVGFSRPQSRVESWFEEVRQSVEFLLRERFAHFLDYAVPLFFWGLDGFLRPRLRLRSGEHLPGLLHCFSQLVGKKAEHLFLATGLGENAFANVLAKRLAMVACKALQPTLLRGGEVDANVFASVLVSGHGESRRWKIT